MRTKTLKARVDVATAEDVPGLIREAKEICDLAGGMLYVPEWVAALAGGNEEAGEALLDYVKEVA